MTHRQAYSSGIVLCFSSLRHLTKMRHWLIVNFWLTTHIQSTGRNNRRAKAERASNTTCEVLPVAQNQTCAHQGLTGTIRAAVSPSKGESQLPLAICRDREGLMSQPTHAALRHDGKMRAIWGSTGKKGSPGVWLKFLPS